MNKLVLEKKHTHTHKSYLQSQHNVSPLLGLLLIDQKPTGKIAYGFQNEAELQTTITMI
jgi:hypothetical protein